MDVGRFGSGGGGGTNTPSDSPSYSSLHVLYEREREKNQILIYICEDFKGVIRVRAQTTFDALRPFL